ncbi:hypothetical protein ACAB91_004503 [Vibrio parahaemolyticus]
MDLRLKAEIVRKHYALASVGGSTLRRQCQPGGKDRAQSFLLNSFPLLELAEIRTETDFVDFLSVKTEELSKLLVVDHRYNWGAARKVLNIYLKLCAANKDLHPFFKLSTVEPFLEVPLDSHVVRSIDKDVSTNFIADFQIKRLTKERSDVIQSVAHSIAANKELYRYELDYLYWNYFKLS